MKLYNNGHVMCHARKCIHVALLCCITRDWIGFVLCYDAHCCDA